MLGASKSENHKMSDDKIREINLPFREKTQ
jgi:hypothetical protein